MELRRIGDVLLRSRTSPLLPFLMPSIPSATWFSSPGYVPLLAANVRASSCSRRFVSSTSTTQASSPAAVLHPEEDEDNPALEPSNQTPPSTSKLELVDKLINDTMSGLTPATAHTRTSRFKSPSAQADNRGTSAGAAREAFESFSTSKDRGRGSPLFGASKMVTSKYNSSAQRLSQDVNHDLLRRDVPLPPRTIRLNPSVGRSVEVDPAKGVNLIQGFARLEAIVVQNGVRRDFARQRFYERPGLKRKRLKGERWRRRFKTGFRAVVDKVETMRRQGW